MKIKTLSNGIALALAAIFMASLLTFRVLADVQLEGNDPSRSEYDVPVGDHYTGRSPYMSRAAKLTPKPTTAKTAAPAPRSGTGSVMAGGSKLVVGEESWGMIRLSKVLPGAVALGGEFVSELTLAAQGGVTNVVVRDAIPDGASYLRSEPAANVEGRQLMWSLGDLTAGQTRKIRVWLKADQEGTLTSCATVSAEARVCVGTFVGRPVLALEQAGPETTLLGQDVTYQIIVKNTGTAAAKGVVVTNPVPSGMSHSSGKTELTFDVGELTPGQNKAFAVTFRANQRGKVCNSASANSSNAGKANAEACTVVLVPGLKVEKSGTKEQILGRNADYEITVSNTGDTTLANVNVSDIVPVETMIVAAPGATLAGNRATWTIASLAPGAKATHAIKLTSKTAGTHCNTVTASSGSVSESAKVCTLWKGIPAVALEVVDDPDPIQVGESTTYTIKVTNQGFANVQNVKIAATFSDAVQPVSTAQGTVNGKNVSFPIVATLGAKQSVTYTITVKGASVGDSRNKITLTATQLQSPVEETESTTVY